MYNCFDTYSTYLSDVKQDNDQWKDGREYIEALRYFE